MVFARGDGTSALPGTLQFSRSVMSDPMNRSTPGLPVHHQLLEFTLRVLQIQAGAKDLRPLPSFKGNVANMSPLAVA